MIREAYERIWYKAKPFFYAANLSPRPFSIQMDITDKCNFRCPGCSKWKGESKEEMGTGQWKSVLSKLKGFAFTNYISVTGGEPFMRHDLFEILRHAKSLGFKICLLTNGSMLDEEKVRELSAIGVEDINISLNSLKEDLHDQTRGVKGSWKKIMDLIPKLKNYRINSNISVVLTNENLDEIPAMARMVKENMLNLLNIQVLADYRVHSPLSKANPKIELDWHKKEKQWIKDKKRLSFTIKKLIRMKKKGYPISNSASHIKNMVNYFSNPRSILKFKCLAGISTLYVGPYGGVRLCYGNEKIGNLLEQSPKAIWTGGPAKKLRKKMKKCRHICRMLNNNFLK